MFSLCLSVQWGGGGEFSCSLVLPQGGTLGLTGPFLGGGGGGVDVGGEGSID